ncbi:MAG: CHAT domain-containing protein [Oscillatoriaceae bacterium SKW80]|nr:CHAT domain-containing protein [Oscillatoriaceae bacterium SKYG93]MCX8122294.1 CHAT domain-containing protein [Oscillatoriaceae bacterium SKW80]MDW8452509.1 CHAT domain-containing protein [Oscillatoriaceae cyanobacterium SKYGB_i_bin93]HIK29645.1 CHAT domain-containing protein [Oscillatoriaceae cyanobacterium M7585_C2015_266]
MSGFLVYFLLAVLLVTGSGNRVWAKASSLTFSEPEFPIQQFPAASNLLQKGRQNYKAGKFRAAVNFLEQAAAAYQAEGASLNQAQALNLLSLAYQQLGEWVLAQTAIAESIKILQKLKQLDPRGTAILAQALNTRGSLELAKGETLSALETWRQAEIAYERAGIQSGKWGSRLNQALALQVLGQYRRSVDILEQINIHLQGQPDTLLKADSLRGLGIGLQAIGDFTRAKKILEQSWAISERLNSPVDTSATLFTLGNLARNLQQPTVALSYYQEAAKLAGSDLMRVQAKLNQVSLLITIGQQSEARQIIDHVFPDIVKLPASRASIYARVNLAESLIKLSGSEEKISPLEIGKILATAVQDARELGDPLGEALALTQVGKLYKQTQQIDDARKVTEEALQTLEGLDADEIVARASWQLGQIFKQEGKIEKAIAAYERAFKSLQALRNDLVAINHEFQFEFKESVEPIYREFVSTLLTGAQVSQANLRKAREVIEALQLAELDNFFGDACLNVKPTNIDEIDNQAAVIYPIILSDRLEVIISLPGQPLRHYTTRLSNQQVETILEKFYSALFPGFSRKERLQISQQIYNWLVKPAEIDLASSNIKTLVFVPDGALRNLPMAALYDGEKYLIEKYSIAISPGLQLFPEKLESRELNVLAAALTEARQGFSALPAVQEEIKEISTQFKSKILLNHQFTRQRFARALETNAYSVIHLATHGQFSSHPEETFLLTWDERISIKDLDLLFKKSRLGIGKPVELLVMSACQTAIGDKRATLGLAGFALRSGARSTLASLWSVNDEATANLMAEFYRQLTRLDSKINKAEALRQAQLSVLQNPLHKHPYFWASFVLVGNWL